MVFTMPLLCHDGRAVASLGVPDRAVRLSAACL